MIIIMTTQIIKGPIYMNDHLRPASWLISCQPLLFKSHINPQIAFVLQGGENPRL